jgi:hypothetical protein
MWRTSLGSVRTSDAEIYREQIVSLIRHTDAVDLALVALGEQCAVRRQPLFLTSERIVDEEKVDVVCARRRCFVKIALVAIYLAPAAYQDRRPQATRRQPRACFRTRVWS